MKLTTTDRAAAVAQLEQIKTKLAQLEQESGEAPDRPAALWRTEAHAHAARRVELLAQAQREQQAEQRARLLAILVPRRNAALDALEAQQAAERHALTADRKAAEAVTVAKGNEAKAAELHAQAVTDREAAELTGTVAAQARAEDAVIARERVLARAVASRLAAEGAKDQTLTTWRAVSDGLRIAQEQAAQLTEWCKYPHKATITDEDRLAMITLEAK